MRFIKWGMTARELKSQELRDKKKGITRDKNGFSCITLTKLGNIEATDFPPGGPVFYPDGFYEDGIIVRDQQQR